MPRLGDAVGQQRPQRRAPVAAVAGPVQHPAARRVPLPLGIEVKGEAVPLRRALDAEHPARVRDLVRRGQGLRLGQDGCRGGRFPHGCGLFPGIVGAQPPLLDKFGEAEPEEQVVELRLKILVPGRLGQVQLQGYVGDDGGQLIAQPGHVLPGGQLPPHRVPDIQRV